MTATLPEHMVIDDTLSLGAEVTCAQWELVKTTALLPILHQRKALWKGFLCQNLVF